jgi:hypothetical protein
MLAKSTIAIILSLCSALGVAAPVAVSDACLPAPMQFPIQSLTFLSSSKRRTLLLLLQSKTGLYTLSTGPLPF